jgi:transposase InsO family protein
LPLLRKTAGDIIIGLRVAQELLPFPLLGLDTDNGREFINHDPMEFCEENKITFARSRAYRKIDQAHVEEKSGSTVRRIIGYDRFEGRGAWKALSEIYCVLGLYVNFFQPSLKLLFKTTI